MKVEENYTGYQVLKRLLVNHVNPYRKKLYLAIFFMLIVAGCAAAIVRFVKPTIDEVFLEKNSTMLYLLSFTLFGIHTLKGVAEYFQTYLLKSVGQRILSDLQIILYEHLLRADVEFISSQSSARLISRFTNDISLMRSAVSNLLVGLAKHLMTVLFLIILMFNLQPVLACIIFIIFPIAIIPIQSNGRKMKNLAYATQEELGNYTAKLDETFESIEVVKSYRAELFESMRAKKFIEHIYNLYKSNARYDALTAPIMETLSGVAIATILLCGGYMVVHNSTTPGTLFAFITAFVSAYRPYKSLVSFNVNLQEGIAAATRLFKVLDQNPKIEENHEGAIFDFKNASIEYKNVFLTIGNKKVLNGVNLKISPNSTIALVGKSGEGKTSIANLLLRFYSVTNGNVYINNTDIAEIQLDCLRSQISLVTQNTHLFDASVTENIAYNISVRNFDDIIIAAKAASAHDFIMQLPNGYDTIIGPQGRTLSGGQRQRIAIARAFLKNSPILILDEATSSLDAETEQEVKNSIGNLCKNRTTIIITHRLNTIEHADRIYVVENGIIAEEGSHNELISNNKQYSMLRNKS